jgi:hypothetical protein
MTTEVEVPVDTSVKEDPQCSIEDRQETGEVNVNTERRKSNSDLLWGEELAVRKSVADGFSGGILSSFFVNGYSAVLIFAFHLISLESLLSIALSVSMTICEFFLRFNKFADPPSILLATNSPVVSFQLKTDAYNKMVRHYSTLDGFCIICLRLTNSGFPPHQEDNESFDGSIMSWVLLSFAVITPMSASIGMAFSRREKALEHLSVIKSTLFSIYSAHACWDWCKTTAAAPSGRAASTICWVEHSDRVLDATIKTCMEMTRMLTLPSASRGRHRVTARGRKEAQVIISLLYKLHRSLLDRMAVITDQCEVFKREGLPPNEATRIRQWERMVVERIGEFATPRILFVPLAVTFKVFVIICCC